MTQIISHNSHTYMKPAKLWMKAINWTAKCQDKTIEQQYDMGIRFFDIRIRYNNNGTVKLVHGLVEYKGSFENVMNFLSSKGDCTLRIMLDDRHNSDTKIQTELLKNNAENYKNTYNIALINIARLSDGKLIYDFNNPMPPVDSQYSSASDHKIAGIYPKLWHKMHDYTDTDKQYIMRDFV